MPRERMYGCDLPTDNPGRAEELAREVLDAGFGWLEFEEFEGSVHTDHWPAYRRMAERLVVRGGFRSSVHLQYRHIEPAALNHDIRVASRAVLRRGIKFAREIGATVAVLHLGETRDLGVVPSTHPRWPQLEAKRVPRFREQLLLAAEALNELAEFAGPGLRLAVENLDVPSGILTTPEDFAALFALNLPTQVGVALDWGHAHVRQQEPLAFLQRLRARVIHCHLHDNDATYDSHLPIGMGTVEFRESVRQFCRQAPAAPLVFELAGNPVSEIQASRRRMETLLDEA